MLSVVSTSLERNDLFALLFVLDPKPAQNLSMLHPTTKHIRTAHSVYLYLVLRRYLSTDAQSFPAGAVDVSEPVQVALAALSHTETTLLFV